MKQQKFPSLPPAKRVLQCKDCPADHKPHVGKLWRRGRWVCHRVAYELDMRDAMLDRMREHLRA